MKGEILPTVKKKIARNRKMTLMVSAKCKNSCGSLFNVWHKVHVSLVKIPS